MADIEIIRDWVKKADEDFQFAVLNLKEQNPFYAQICFHFHQAAEKYLKAYVVANELEFRKIHDLPLLLTGEIIEDYPDDKPFPTALFLGWLQEEPFHVVTALDPVSGYCFVITVYRPDLDHFEPDYKTRR